MKNFISKTGIVLIIGLLFSFNTKAQLTLTCESGNRATEQAACWGFGATSYANTSVINGSWSTRSNSLTSTSLGACWIKTPWMKMGNGNITFKVKLDGAGNGVSMKRVIVSYIPYDAANVTYLEGAPIRIDSVVFTNFNSTAIVNASIPIPAAIANDNNNVYKILFSYIGTGGNERAYSDDFVIPGTYWSDPSNSCKPLPTIQDVDLDGVADADDAFPNDQYKAYKTFFPVPNHFSSLAFEDLWPAKGDYDFNDVVVDHYSEIVSNAQNQVVEVNYQFKVRAIGASFKNGFGFELTNINPNAIRSVSGTNIKPGSIYNIAANGTENGQTNATIIAIGNVFDVLPFMGGASYGINTSPGAPYSTPQILNVKLTFMENGVPGTSGAVNVSQLGSNTFNPFIVVNQSRGKEVHLADYKPTSLANPALFGTLDDDSNPAQNRYYRTKNNLPWALSTYESFQYPIEKAEVTKAYLKLIDWVISNGTQYTDWDTNPAYRDNNYIYTIPQ
jgi:LruC domain-containing protein